MTEALMDYMPHFSNPTVLALAILCGCLFAIGLVELLFDGLVSYRLVLLVGWLARDVDDVPFAVADCREIETKETPESVAAQG